jgi:hypothetical protein
VQIPNTTQLQGGGGVTWAEACAALLEGKKVRRDEWGHLRWSIQANLAGERVLRDHCGWSVVIFAEELEATDWEVIPNENQ